MVIEVRDGMTPVLEAIQHISRDVAFEVMSKVGNTIRLNAGNRMRSPSHHHGWMQVSHKGRLEPYFSQTKTKELGERTDKSGKTASPDSMSAMISSFLMEKSGVLVVGGLSPNFTPITRKDGKITGVGKRVGAIGQHTQSIIHKLDTGERNKHHGWGKLGRIKQNPFFRDPRFKGRHFMKAGFNDSKSYMAQQLTTAYKEIVGRAINKVEIKPKVYKRRMG